MAEWNKNNLAHTNTFLALRILVQMNKDFDNAGGETMKKLAFWVAEESATLRRARAKSLASQLHNLFSMVFRSQLEEGVTKTASIKAMADLLANGESTVCDLADTADAQYDFSELELA